MIYNNDFSSKMYERLSELEEKLMKSEAERKLLEAKFLFMAESYKTEEERRLKNLREKYAEFMEDCKERSRRNDDILKSLQKVENGANAVYAKTERLKQLRSHYDAYLSRATPLWRHPDILQLQAPDATLRSPWIREPRMNMAVTRPALLLPGGGAVMLPVDESGMTVPLGARPDTHILTPDSEVRKLRLSESMASAKDAKIISTLGEAGQRMMKELKLMEGSHYSYLLNSPKIQPAPVYYHSYHLPVYIPPLYGPTAICAPPTIDYRPEIISPPQQSRPMKTDPDQSVLPERKVPEVTKKKNVVSTEDRKSERFEKTADNVEIECLAADGNFIEEDDANLSDDEVLDVALARSQSPFRNGHPINNAKSEWINQNNSPSAYPEKPIEPKYKETKFDNVTPVAKKIAVAHQKSIEELKARLSFEEDEEAPVAPLEYSEPDQMYTVDEDVPEEFTEQNYTEPNYDPRFQRDVSRNVILEEDEEEEEEKPLISREEEWRRSQEKNSYSEVPSKRTDQPAPKMSMERHGLSKSPQQYAQQFKALIKKKKATEEPTPVAPQIQRQPSRAAIMAEPEDGRRYIEVDSNLVSHHVLPSEVQENSPQGQTNVTSEFSSMPSRREDLNMERDGFIRDELQPNEFQAPETYEPDYGANFDQPQPFENYDRQVHYEEPNQNEQYPDYQEPGQPGEQYYEENRGEPYLHPEQEIQYQPGEPMPDYYPEQTENDNLYPEQPLENYPPNEFYEGDLNQPQYMEQYANYGEGQPEPQYYDEQQQQDGYHTEEQQRVYEDDAVYAQYQSEPLEQNIENSGPISSPARNGNVTNGGGVPRPSILNQLLDSESESYQVDPAGSAPDDSDFDFSIGKS